MKNILILVFIGLSTFCKGGTFKEYPNKKLKLNQKVFIAGKKRSYHIYVPDNSKNRPLVVLLHGNRGSANQVIGKSIVKSPQKIWLDLAEEHKFIVVVPNGSRGPERHRGWNDCRTDAVGNPDSNDVLFIKLLLEKVKDKYDHDPKKVYIAGISNGGIMANRLAMEIPNDITAFASVVSSMAVNSSCLDSNIPVSALYMNGTTDPILPYDGGHIASKRGEVKSTDQCINYWIARNNTSNIAVETALDNKNMEDQSKAIKYLYKNGTNNTEVALYKIINGGHTEPSLEKHYRKLYKKIVGNQNKDFEMASEIWSFFKDKSK